MIEMGKRIREMRKQYGYTLDDVGQKIGIKKSTLSKLENGKIQRIDRAYIDKIARLFKCDPAYLMGYEDTPHVDLTYSAPGKENVNVTVSSNPIIGPSSKIVELYDILLSIKPENYDIAIKLLKTLL